MTTATPIRTSKRGTTVTVTQEIDFAALAGKVQDAKEEKIEREGGAGRPAEPNPFENVMKQARTDGKVKELVVPQAAEKKVVNYLRRAASANGHGLKLKVRYDKSGNAKVVFQASDKKAVGGKVECPVCHKEVTTTSDGLVRQHGEREKKDYKGNVVTPAKVCAGSGRKVE